MCLMRKSPHPRGFWRPSSLAVRSGGSTSGMGPERARSGPIPHPETPDLDAKLAGEQKPRGWGLFLIRHMVDAMDVSAADGLQTVTLTLARDGR